MHPALGSVTEHIWAVLCEGLVACDRLFVEGLCVLTVPAISTDFTTVRSAVLHGIAAPVWTVGVGSHTQCVTRSFLPARFLNLT